MEMTIDEAIKRIDNIMFTRFTTIKDEDAFFTAKDTMRKYKKIEQILKDIPYGGDVTVRRIQEVVEDDSN